MNLTIDILAGYGMLMVATQVLFGIIVFKIYMGYRKNDLEKKVLISENSQEYQIAYNKGHSAYLNGYSSNPYTYGQMEYIAWKNGFDYGRSDD